MERDYLTAGDEERRPTIKRPAAARQKDKSRRVVREQVATQAEPSPTHADGSNPGNARKRRKRDNLLLGALPETERKRLNPFLEEVELQQSADLILANEPIQNVYFPISAITSTLQELSDGSSIEVGLMGLEGLVGIQFWLMQRTTPAHTIVQVAGKALRMSSKDFKREVVDTRSPLNPLVASYTHAFLNMTAQTSACNRLHEVETRLARWLCLVYDRVLDKEFALRQEFLAAMLGVHRPSVTIAAAALQKAGLSSYSRGVIRIEQPEMLRRSACECLGIIESQFDNMFGRQWRDPA